MSVVYPTSAVFNDTIVGQTNISYIYFYSSEETNRYGKLVSNSDELFIVDGDNYVSQFEYIITPGYNSITIVFQPTDEGTLSTHFDTFYKVLIGDSYTQTANINILGIGISGDNYLPKINNHHDQTVEKILYMYKKVT
jgi:hypothetical protein